MWRAAELNGVAVPALRLNQAGYTHEQPCFKMGPRKIKEFGFGYIYAGRGWVTQSGVRCTLDDGDLFLIFPGIRYAFAATNSRWKVYWANFTAAGLAQVLRRAGITPRRYVRNVGDLEAAKNLFETLIAAGEDGVARNLPLAAARIWEMLALLQAPQPRNRRSLPEPVEAARLYLDEHLHELVPVTALARRAHLSQCHFIRLFRREIGLSPRQYQINRRLLAARRLLRSGKSVKETAHALAYDDLFYFSRLFKRKTGIPPSQYAQAGVL
ncbi:MAG: helix-turn-helix transcriptional regulator [Planctomycetes bacterium]|nr:helix-turn-helix transcriptional regulator [Planctomycetota bacterium]